jgi:hypothetical protein
LPPLHMLTSLMLSHLQILLALTHRRRLALSQVAWTGLVNVSPIGLFRELAHQIPISRQLSPTTTLNLSNTDNVHLPTFTPTQNSTQ